jgi:transposase InsO family protein
VAVDVTLEAELAWVMSARGGLSPDTRAAILAIVEAGQGGVTDRSNPRPYSVSRRRDQRYDFVAERTEDGRALRMVVIDEFTRECLAIEVGRSFTSDDLIGVLQYLFAIRGVPEHIRSDNGPEFVAKGIRRWLAQAGVSTLFIAKSSPWENGYVESFNGKFRDELLNGELFFGLADARWVIDRWRLDDNHRRPNSALGYQTPAAFAANCVLEDSATLHPPEHRTTTDPKLSHSEWYKIWG